MESYFRPWSCWTFTPLLFALCAMYLKDSLPQSKKITNRQTMKPNKHYFGEKKENHFLTSRCLGVSSATRQTDRVPSFWQGLRKLTFCWLHFRCWPHLACGERSAPPPLSLTEVKELPLYHQLDVARSLRTTIDTYHT